MEQLLRTAIGSHRPMTSNVSRSVMRMPGGSLGTIVVSAAERHVLSATSPRQHPLRDRRGAKLQETILFVSLRRVVLLLQSLSHL
jgi:hypothetical protein